MLCPCQMQQPLPKAYAQCCERAHLGNMPNTPEQLMRSRFSAYVLGLSEYVRQSWHASTRPPNLQLAADDHWLKLDIIKAQGKQVHFRAYFNDEDGFAVLEEISDFIFEDSRWFYVDGQTDTRSVNLNRNDMCLCGRHKKFKKCCG